MILGKTNIVLIGMPGSGKTTIGKKLAMKSKKEFVDTDAFIEESSGKKISDLFLVGEDYFREIESDIIKKIASRENIIISTGGGVIKREKNIKHLKENGVIFFINRPPELIIKDIKISTRPLLKNKRESVWTLYKERINLYKSYCDIEVENVDSLEKTVDKILIQCKEMGLI
ncbi:MAG: shikimate kinase [Clostridiales bacterium]|uniref:shikimate kinase n=1 Tax=Clostridium sp. N3C TaxID=1776758 RepID=UPI00092DF874|nr:shikimate kinase [Clostridium sp. N3C]NLZ49975.1 shikimate kinase [Clostridiales bacterium]SCN22372.1 Shikimate kinase [Clostridium sp. N3C]